MVEVSASLIAAAASVIAALVARRANTAATSSKARLRGIEAHLVATRDAVEELLEEWRRFS